MCPMEDSPVQHFNIISFLKMTWSSARLGLAPSACGATPEMVQGGPARTPGGVRVASPGEAWMPQAAPSSAPAHHEELRPPRAIRLALPGPVRALAGLRGDGGHA